MATKCTFVAKADQLEFRTKTNGDYLRLSGIHIDADNAADLARMIQDGNDLDVTIKEKHE